MLCYILYKLIYIPYTLCSIHWNDIANLIATHIAPNSYIGEVNWVDTHFHDFFLPNTYRFPICFLLGKKYYFYRCLPIYFYLSTLWELLFLILLKSSTIGFKCNFLNFFKNCFHLWSPYNLF